MTNYELSAMGRLAQETASKGIRLFPFNPIDKRPYKGFDRWPERATCDTEQVRQWWVTWPEAMVAVLTGRSNGFFVLDIDAGVGKQGFESLKELEKRYGSLPVTMAVCTPSGGVHLYFRMPEGVDVKNSESVIAPHIDIRGDGGCVMWPGSVRPNGIYRLVDDWRKECQF